MPKPINLSQSSINWKKIGMQNPLDIPPTNEEKSAKQIYRERAEQRKKAEEERELAHIEELKQQLLNEKEKLYLAHLEITNGESEYCIPKVVRAKTLDEAETKAEKWISDFWGDKTRRDENGVYWKYDETECIQVSSIEESTTEQIVQSLTISGKVS